MLGNIKFRRDAQQLVRSLGLREDRAFATEKVPKDCQSSGSTLLFSHGAACVRMGVGMRGALGWGAGLLLHRNKGPHSLGEHFTKFFQEKKSRMTSLADS